MLWKAYLGIHVGSIHVDLAAVVMNDLADLVDALLIHAVRAGVGDHERCQAAEQGSSPQRPPIATALKSCKSHDVCRTRAQALGAGQLVL